MTTRAAWWHRRGGTISSHHPIAIAALTFICVALLFGSFSLAQPLAASPERQASNDGNLLLPSLHPIVERVLPAVVNVSVTMKESLNSSEEDQGANDSREKPVRSKSPLEDLLRRFFEGLGSVQTISLGSGFILDSTGYIVTNNHVIDQAENITVILQDNSRHAARLVGGDADTDLALLKIDSDRSLPTVQWGDSDAAEVGDWVMAVGNPFGFGGTVTAGIISARGRELQSESYGDFLQIDAPINRGNSGGPTFNMNAEVIGINTAIASPGGGSVGIAFAIPASVARPVIDQLRERGKVERGWLGVEIQSLTPEIADFLGRQNDRGALVATVKNNSPAANAGLKQGDVILSFDGHPIERPRDLTVAVAKTPIGKEVDVAVWRDGKLVGIRAIVAERVDVDEGAEHTSPVLQARKSGTLGLTFESLTRDLRQQLGVPTDVRGAVVADVAPNSPARAVIRRGDVIQSINQHSISSPTEAIASLAAAEKSGKKNLLILLNRGGSNQYIGVGLG